MPLAQDNARVPVQGAHSVLQTQNLNIPLAAGPAAETAPITAGSRTRYVLLVATVDCWVRISATGSASASGDSMLVSSGTEVLRPISPGQRISALGGTLAGVLNISECG